MIQWGTPGQGSSTTDEWSKIIGKDGQPLPSTPTGSSSQLKTTGVNIATWFGVVVGIISLLSMLTGAIYWVYSVNGDLNSLSTTTAEINKKVEENIKHIEEVSDSVDSNGTLLTVNKELQDSILQKLDNLNNTVTEFFMKKLVNQDSLPDADIPQKSLNETSKPKNSE